MAFRRIVGPVAFRYRRSPEEHHRMALDHNPFVVGIVDRHMAAAEVHHMAAELGLRNPGLGRHNFAQGLRS